MVGWGVGFGDGKSVGFGVGSSVGFGVGIDDGSFVGFGEGDSVGLGDGTSVGFGVGNGLGSRVGFGDGTSVGFGVGNGLGYAVILLIVGFVRELLGSGSVFGLTILPTVQNGGWYVPNGLMLLPPSAFFVIGLLIWVLRTLNPEQVEKTDEDEKKRKQRVWGGFQERFQK